MTREIEVGRSEEFVEGRARVVRVDGRRIAIFRVQGKLFALDDACPHMGASLAEGHLEGGRIVCAWHGWSFDLASGESGRRSGACARGHEVEVRDGLVFLALAAPKPKPQVSEEEWPVWDPERHLRTRRDDEDL